MRQAFQDEYQRSTPSLWQVAPARPFLGFARVIFLIGTIGPLALVRLAAGFLLAIAPLVAGLLLLTPLQLIC